MKPEQKEELDKKPINKLERHSPYLKELIVGFALFLSLLFFIMQDVGEVFFQSSIFDRLKPWLCKLGILICD